MVTEWYHLQLPNMIPKTRLSYVTKNKTPIKKISMLYSTNVSFPAESVLVQLSKAEKFTHSDKNIHFVVFV